ncbi:hypothetical protein [Streptomyces sp. AJS327]|nr:hypothetical protein [Streptomyces sp. AJS327]
MDRNLARDGEAPRSTLHTLTSDGEALLATTRQRTREDLGIHD